MQTADPHDRAPRRSPASALALAGSVVALRAAAPESRAVTLGTVDVHVVPARKGEMDVYVPVVDWGVRAEPYTAPRQRASSSSARSTATRRSPPYAREAAPTPASRASSRSFATPSPTACAARPPSRSWGRPSAGCSAARSIAGLHRRRWLLLGPATGLAVTFAAVVARRRRREPVRLRGPARARPSTRTATSCRASSSSRSALLAAGEGYDDSYGDAVEGLTRLIAVAGERAAATRRSSTGRSSSPPISTRTASSCPSSRASRRESRSSSSAT